jgi:anti-sigma factor RsiW
VPDENPRDPTTWVKRAEDPRLVEVARLVRLWPAILALWTLVMGAGSVGAWWSLMRANQVTKVQFETEQAERREAESASAQRLSKLEGKIDVLIMQLGKGRK